MKIKCNCGKMLARFENGRLYLWCKSCRREIEYIPTLGSDGAIVFVLSK